MRRITLAILSTLAVLVLLLSYRASLGQSVAAQPADRAHVVAGGASPATVTGQGPDPAGSSPGTTALPVPITAAPTDTTAAAPTTAPDPAAVAPATTGSVVVDGDGEVTPYGTVQVQVTIAAGRITDVTAIRYPTAEQRSQQINQVALPQLHSEVLAAQSAKVDAVSGATFTTEGYLTSLQSALDAAHVGL